MNKSLCGFGVAVAVATWSVASSTPTTGGAATPAAMQQAVLKVDRAWADAEINRDAAALRRILDDHFIATYGAGGSVDKEAFIKDVIGDPNDKLQSQDLSDIEVRIAANTAVVVETDTVHGVNNGQPYAAALRITTTYIKRPTGWVALAEHVGRATDLAADEAAVRKADVDWVRAAQSRKVDAWLAFYADDAVVLPPNDALVSGRESARKGIAALLALPDLAIAWQPTKVEVSRSGDSAYSLGTYALSYKGANGAPVSDQGKYLEQWQKQPDGQWKCSADAWSSDLPAAK